MIHEWTNLLRDAIKGEYGNHLTVMILATLSRNGDPRARAVVCRAIDDDGTIWFVSDSRSKKNRQMRHHHRVELVFWLPKLRRQFRVRGKAKLVKADDRRARELWKDLPGSTRALFTWPAPGRKRVEPDKRFAKSVSPRVPAPGSFEAIAIRPTMVEELNLKPHPHRRQRWRQKNHWRSERINP